MASKAAAARRLPAGISRLGRYGVDAWLGVVDVSAMRRLGMGNDRFGSVRCPMTTDLPTRNQADEAVGNHRIAWGLKLLTAYVRGVLRGPCVHGRYEPHWAPMDEQQIETVTITAEKRCDPWGNK